MGLNFTTLVHYAGPNGDALRAIARLEEGEGDPALAEVVACGRRNGFAFAQNVGPQAFWRPLNDCEQKLPQRPGLPSLQACLSLPSSFLLTFGHDTVWVCHTLRWLFFVTEPQWQQAMLAAAKRFCELFGARDCIVANDGHAAVSAFLRGASFDDALNIAKREGEGEVASLAELYREIEDDSDLALKPVRGPAASLLEARMVRWPRRTPLPEGWSRPTSWNSNGFWRYQWQAAGSP